MPNNLYHKPWVRQLRSTARKLGVLRLLKPLMAKQHQSYEQAFHLALKSAVKPGDTVWDVGANVGLYTTQFLDWVGSTGNVVAFEPLPKASEVLRKAVIKHPNRANATIECVALSDKPGQAVFVEEPTAGEHVMTTAHLTDTSESPSGGISVKVSTADLMVSRGTRRPNVVKIDVEGFEEDVLRGGSKLFSLPVCHDVLIEMHFTRMDERKLGDSASRIVGMLKNWGYRVTWVDPSHLHASR